jgi:hypothetical protein
MDAPALLASVLYACIAHTWEPDGRVTLGWPVPVVAWATEQYDDANSGLDELESRLWCTSHGLDPETWPAWI